MKKTLIAMAAVAVAGVASAQVTITGSIGFGVSDTSATARTANWTDGGITFSASEDLGGGLTAAASVTQAINGKGAAVNSDGNSLSLTSANMGALAIGTARASGDALGVSSAGYTTGHLFGTSETVDGTANYTYVQYTLPAIVDGLSIAVRKAGNQDNGVATSASNQMRFTYKTGDLTLDFNTTSEAAGAKSDLKGTYVVQGITLAAFADTATQNGGAKRNEFSISAPLGALTLAASTGTQGTRSGNEVNLTYALSKRTSLVAGAGTYRKSDGDLATTSANRIKLLHSF
jgi:predicted porin